MIIRILVLPLLSAYLYWLSSPPLPFPLSCGYASCPWGILCGRLPGPRSAGGFVYGFFFWLFAVWWIRIPLSSWLAFRLAGVGAGRDVLRLPMPCLWPLRVPGRKVPAHGDLRGTCLQRFPYRDPLLVSHVFFGSEAHTCMHGPSLSGLDLGGSPLLLFLIYLVNFRSSGCSRPGTPEGLPCPPWLPFTGRRASYRLWRVPPHSYHER
jgi:hypothetical protein